MLELDHLLQLIQSRYNLEPFTQATRLTGGEWKNLWRLDGAESTYVVSLSHPTTTVESIAYEHRLLRYLQAQLPQVPAPLLAQDGSSYFIDDGRLISLLPLMPGKVVEDAQARLAAARLLARFHEVGRGYPDLTPRPGVPAWQQWDWHATTWPSIQTMLATTAETTLTVGQRFWQACGEWTPQIVARRQQIEEERSYFQQWIAALAQSERSLTVGLLHDDYHSKNLLMEGEEVTALLDWDGCHPDWLVFDVSNAIWEFCQDETGDSLDVAAAQRFLAVYAEAGGPVSTQEFDLIILLIRCRRMIEVFGSLRGIALGESWDNSPDYLVHNLVALDNLRGIRL